MVTQICPNLVEGSHKAIAYPLVITRNHQWIRYCGDSAVPAMRVNPVSRGRLSDELSQSHRKALPKEL